MENEKRSSQIIIEENQRLKSAVAELSILNEIATAISSTLSLEQIIDLIVQKCVKHLQVEEGAVMLIDAADESSQFRTFIRKQDSGIIESDSFHLDTQISSWMMLHKVPLLINDFENNDRIKYFEKRADLRSILAVPLMLKGRLMGVVSVFNKRNEAGFTNEDQRLLSIIAGQSSQVIENARLMLKEQTLIKVQEEMKFATKIQTDLFPKEIPKYPGYQLAGMSLPAKEVGGDYYDFIKIDNNSVAFCVADISGKGLPAALLMANLQATLRGQAFIKAACTDCVSFANDILYSNTDAAKYATLFYGILNSKENMISYCNAGHNPPFLFTNGNEINKLETGGTVVGIMPSYPYQKGECELKLDDVLVLYSDGITEAMNMKNEEYGEERMLEVIRANLSCTSEEIVQKILASVKAFSDRVEQSDDITLMVIKKVL